MLLNSNASADKILLLSEVYADGGEPIAGPSGLQRESVESSTGSESEAESSSSSDEGSEYNAPEGKQGQNRLQPAENEIEGDFEYAPSLSLSDRL